jgi:hypothetical protein
MLIENDIEQDQRSLIIRLKEIIEELKGKI